MQANCTFVDITIHHDLAEVRERWQALERTGALTAFQSIEWITTLLTSSASEGANGARFVFAIDKKTGADLMLLPLVERRLGPLRTLEVPDFGVSDYNYPILSDQLAASPELFDIVWKSLVANLSDAALLRINKIPAEIGGQTTVLSQQPLCWQKDAMSWLVNLPAEWSEFEGRLSSKVRRQIKSDLRNIGRHDKVVFEEARDLKAATEFFDALCTQRASRFRRLGRYDILSNPMHREFYWRILEQGITSGFGTISALRVGQRIAATMLGLKYRDRYIALIPTMNEEITSHGLGKLMAWHQIAEMQRQKFLNFDTAIGYEPYKKDFGAVPKPLYELAMPLDVAGHVVRWAYKGRRAWLSRGQEITAHQSAGG